MRTSVFISHPCKQCFHPVVHQTWARCATHLAHPLQPPPAAAVLLPGQTATARPGTPLDLPATATAAPAAGPAIADSRHHPQGWLRLTQQHGVLRTAVQQPDGSKHEASQHSIQPELRRDCFWRSLSQLQPIQPTEKRQTFVNLEHLACSSTTYMHPSPVSRPAERSPQATPRRTAMLTAR